MDAWFLAYCLFIGCSIAWLFYRAATGDRLSIILLSVFVMLEVSADIYSRKEDSLGRWPRVYQGILWRQP